MTVHDYIKLKAFNLPQTEYFSIVLNDIESKYDKDEYNDESSLFCHIDATLKEQFPHVFRVKFRDNDFCKHVLVACEAFAEQYEGEYLYKLYEDISRNKDGITIESYMTLYIVQKAYANYISNVCRFSEISFAPVIEDKKIFDYLIKNISVETVEYVPDEISIIERQGIFDSIGDGDKYIYKDAFWNHEECFIDIESNKVNIL